MTKKLKNITVMPSKIAVGLKAVIYLLSFGVLVYVIYLLYTMCTVLLDGVHL